MINSFLQQFGSTLKQYYPVSDTTIKIVFAQCSIKTFLKNETIARESRADPFEHFLLSGILHSYSVSADLEEDTTGIFLPQTVITPHIVRTLEGRSIQYLGCLLDAVIATIPFKVFNSLMQEYGDLRAFGYKVVETELSLKTKREVSLLTLTAKERLMKFRKEYDNLENIIPHSIISGFLGITPVSFGRLRNELASSRG